MTRNPMPKSAAIGRDARRAAIPTGSAFRRTPWRRSLQARHGDPFAVLGPHQVRPACGRSAPCCRTRAAVTILSPAAQTMLGRWRGAIAAGFFVGVAPGRDRPDYRLRIETAGWRDPVHYDPYRFGPVLSEDDLDSSGDVGSDARLPAARRAQVDVERRRRASASPSGRPTPAASASSATSTAGTAAATRCACATSAASGSCSSPAWLRRRATSSRSGRRRRAAAPEGGSRRLRGRASARHRLGRCTASPATEWRDADWMAGARAPEIRARRPCPSTSAISARGRGCPRKATAI